MSEGLNDTVQIALYCSHFWILFSTCLFFDLDNSLFFKAPFYSYSFIIRNVGLRLRYKLFVLNYFKVHIHLRTVLCIVLYFHLHLDLFTLEIDWNKVYVHIVKRFCCCGV